MNTTRNPIPRTSGARLVGLALTALALTALGALVGCTESIEPLTPMPDGGARVDAAAQHADAAAEDSGGFDAAGRQDVNPPDALAAEVAEDAASIRYERDLRPLLEASACGSCHAEVGVVMDYAWMSAPGDSWCDGDFGYERRWSCFEEHARTQTAGAGEECDSDFYHRHGEPCFEEQTRSRVLEWAADGFLE